MAFFFPVTTHRTPSSIVNVPTDSTHTKNICSVNYNCKLPYLHKTMMTTTTIMIKKTTVPPPTEIHLIVSVNQRRINGNSYYTH